MALTETLDSPQSSSSSDPQLLRNLSSSRLNAQAPEFVPTRSTSQQQQQQQQSMRMMIPPPPPPGIMHVYSPPPAPAGAAFHLPVPMPPHLVPVPHHMSMRNHHHHHPYQNHHHREQEVEAVAKKDHQEHKDHGSISSKNGLSEEATLKILNQVEYYFGDLNLATTDHLMRFINKDPDGYVPISVVASFKKIKALVTTHSQLATVLRNSAKLVVSEDGKKVRRQHPLTESDMEELQSRIIVAENLPEDHCHQNLMKIFSAVGSVKTIRTCQPQPSGGGMSSASRSAKSDGMHFSNKLHAFVEYETVELAEKAVAELNEEGNWRSGLRVRLMLRHVGEEHSNEKEGGQKKGRNRGRGKGRGRTQYHNNHHSSHGNHVGTPPSASSNWVSNEQATGAKQPPGPRMPDGTRGFAMGRGKPVAVNTA
ncbi:La-related 7 [Gossypium arboreum]|uniref:La-related 7 n=1 Tax=Gossypium arboreum TaxID=29729 RepID=A0A0B0MTE7_GOSAR|nr:La-related 7 [Gossypium arboreum]